MQTLFGINFVWVLVGTGLLGLVSGLLSVYTVLRRQSLLGDVMAHASLPGICVAFLLFGEKSLLLFIVAAVLSGLLAAACIEWIVRYSKLRQDAAMAIVLSVFFGLGMMLLTVIQQSPNGNQAGIDRFLFGQAASLVMSDILLLGTAGIVILLLIIWLFHVLKMVTFDPAFARSVGVRVGAMQYVLTAMVVAVVMLGLQIAGAILVAALLITPALAARFWTSRMSVMLWLSAIFGMVGGLGGTVISTLGGDWPTGPLIVLTSAGLFLLSALFAPRRGWLAQRLRHVRSGGGTA
jgi:manganese/zinc/iron transport system permease protein